MHKEIITPERAHELLELNHNNRNLAQRFVDRYASDMAAGLWRDVGDPLRFSKDRLLDGQHRLHAIIKSGVTLEMWVVNDLRDEDITVLDTGKVRVLSDTLRWSGAANPSKSSPVVRALCVLSRGFNLRDANKSVLTTSVLTEFYLQHSELIDRSVRRGENVRNRLGLSCGQWATAFAWLGYCGVDDELVEQFYALLAAEGSNLDLGSPILALRSWATKRAINRVNLRRDELLIAVLKAYNAWIAGTPIKAMRVSPDESLPEVAIV